MWKKPLGLKFKVNWEAVVDNQNNKGGIGLVIKNSEGELMASLCLNINCSMNIAEACALRRAAILCQELGLFDVVLELGDSKVIVAATNSREELNVDYGIVVADVHSIIADRDNWSICVTHRDANNVAYIC